MSFTSKFVTPPFNGTNCNRFGFLLQMKGAREVIADVVVHATDYHESENMQNLDKLKFYLLDLMEKGNNFCLLLFKMNYSNFSMHSRFPVLVPKSPQPY